MRCSDVIELNTKPRRYVGDILSVNRESVKMRKSGNCFAMVIRSQIVYFDRCYVVLLMLYFF